MNRYLLAFILLVSAILLAVGGWHGLKWLQVKRADYLLNSANSHMEKANGLMGDIKLEQLSSESFTSLDNINLASTALQEMKPFLEQAATEVRQAELDAGSAATMPLLPEWQNEYLQKKQETAAIREQQIASLVEIVSRLQQLYAVGSVVFSSVQEMDRLFGQFQAAMGRVQSSPVEASESLGQIARSFSQVQKQLEESYRQTGFEILPELSKTAADNAELSALAAQLADAAGAGDQGRAQRAAIQLEEKLLSASIAGNAIDSWWQSQIKPLEQEYSDLQMREEALDVEAATLYSSRR
ncbi:MAG: hypothetical protein JJD96_04240 [Thermoleophilia bacterium]|nr:hypothetical protein [Thermoleophilia bacterium]